MVGIFGEEMYDLCDALKRFAGAGLSACARGIGSGVRLCKREHSEARVHVWGQCFQFAGHQHRCYGCGGAVGSPNR
jgi:hypothetical protein